MTLPWLALSGEIPDERLVPATAGIGLLRSEYVIRASGHFVTALQCIDAIRSYLSQVAALLYPKPVWYRLSDLECRDANQLIGVDRVIHEDNPILGLRGTRRARALPKAMQSELAAVAAVRESWSNVGICFPYLRDADDFGFAASMAAALTDAPLAAMLEVPAILSDLERLIPLNPSLCIFGLNDLTTLTLGSLRTAQDYDQAHPVLVRQLQHASNRLSAAGIPALIAGNLDQMAMQRWIDAFGADRMIVHYSEWRKLVGTELGPMRDEDRFCELRRASDDKLVRAGAMTADDAVRVSGWRP